MTPPFNLYDFSRPALNELLADWGFSHYHANLLWEALYQQQGDFSALRPDLNGRLQSQTTHALPTAVTDLASADGQTRKFLLRLADGQTIETVLMQFEGRDGLPRATACISTQAGCAMGCIFCATGQMGFTRHLTPGEIVAQVLFANQHRPAGSEPLRNIVLMGMGEPLHNYNHTMTALDILMDHKGLSIAPKHITLSTVGLVPGIIRLADEARPFRLAVSLHGATDAERQALVPPARRWPLADLMDACRYYITKRQRRIFFEWTLIEGQNDTPASPCPRPTAHRPGSARQPHPAQSNQRLRRPTDRGNGRQDLPVHPRRLQPAQHRPPTARHRHRRRLRPIKSDNQTLRIFS